MPRTDLDYRPIPELVIRKWLLRIDLSPTREMLRHVGNLLARTQDTISDEARAYMRELYVARMKQLREAGQ